MAEDREATDRRGEPRAARVSRTERVSRVIAGFTGSTPALWLVIVFVIAWLTIGSLVAESSGLAGSFQQLVDGLSFVMLFVLQRSQNKDTKALQLKLDELVASSPRASNRVLNLEEIPEAEMRQIQRHFETLERLSRARAERTLSEEDAHRRDAEERRFAAERARGDD